MCNGGDKITPEWFSHERTGGGIIKLVKAGVQAIIQTMSGLFQLNYKSGICLKDAGDDNNLYSKEGRSNQDWKLPADC